MKGSAKLKNSMALVNPFTQDPITHPTISWSTLFEAITQPFRLRQHPAESDAVLVVGLNGQIHSHNLTTAAIQPYVTTGGQPTDIVSLAGDRSVVISDTAWNNLLTMKDGQAHALLGQDTGIIGPSSLVHINGTVYFADQTGLFAFSSDGIAQRLLDQPGITALCAVNSCVMMSVNGENCVKALRPGFQPVIYSNGFYGAHRLVDMCTGPHESLLIVTENIAPRGKAAEGAELPLFGYLYIISSYGVPSACVSLPGVPQSVAHISGKILVSVAESREIFAADISAFM